MDKPGIIIMVILILIMGGYLVVRGGFQHNIREGLTGWWDIKNEQDCTAAGGSSWATCPTDGTKYCAGPCAGSGHKCMIPPDPTRVAEFKRAWEREEILLTGGMLPFADYEILGNQKAAEEFPTTWNGMEWNACINPGAPSSGVKADNPYATASTMTCPPSFPYLLTYANGDKFCYETADGNTTGSALCNCDCQDCGFNSSFPNCTELGNQYSCQSCNNLYEKGPGCTPSDVLGCKSCAECWAQGPGYWCRDTNQCVNIQQTSRCSDGSSPGNCEGITA